jgi:hypothetical protein
MHNSPNAEGEMITSIVVTGGNRPDGKQFPELVGKDGKLGLPVKVYSADGGYDDGNNRYLLERLGLQSPSTSTATARRRRMGTKRSGWR